MSGGGAANGKVIPSWTYPKICIPRREYIQTFFQSESVAAGQFVFMEILEQFSSEATPIALIALVRDTRWPKLKCHCHMRAMARNLAKSIAKFGGQVTGRKPPSGKTQVGVGRETRS